MPLPTPSGPWLLLRAISPAAPPGILSRAQAPARRMTSPRFPGKYSDVVPVIQAVIGLIWN